MSTAELTLAVSVFLACTVEAVEALTIVLAVGVTRSWSSALIGAGCALAALALAIGVFGSALGTLPIDPLRVLIGGLLLVFGLQWLKKAIRRMAGVLALHDESEAFARETKAARSLSLRPSAIDSYAFTVAFKGTLLEGLEVTFIVLGFGSNQHRLGLAVLAAAAAVVLVIVVGIAVRAPLARVPENSMKFAVGVMVSSFGIFWGVQGAGASWPGGDAAVLVLAALLALTALGLVARMRRVPASPTRQRRTRSAAAMRPRTTLLPSPVAATWRFFAGDDWPTAVAVILALALTALLSRAGITAWWLVPVAVLVSLFLALSRPIS